MRNSGGMRSMKRQGGWVGLALGGISAASSLIGGSKAKKAAKKAGRAQARAIMETGAEQMRRTKESQRQALGGAQAASAASGIQNTGSTAAAQGAMRTEFIRELEWMDKATKSAAAAARSGASAAGDAYMRQGLGSALGAIGSAVASTDMFNDPLTPPGAGSVRVPNK